MHETIYGDLQSEIGYGTAKKLRTLFDTGSVEEITEGFMKLWEKPSKPHAKRRLASANKYYKPKQ